MDSNHAVKVLREHNEWRRGNRLETWDRMPYSPAELGAAIDSVCDALSERDRMLGEAVELIHEFSDHEKRPCSHDHHGTCQEHPGASYKGCPVAKSRTFLSAYDASKKEKV